MAHKAQCLEGVGGGEKGQGKKSKKDHTVRKADHTQKLYQS